VDTFDLAKNLAKMHEAESRYAINLGTDRQHDVDRDPARFQPHYICPFSGTR
jgi:hypothetical protein